MKSLKKWNPVLKISYHTHIYNTLLFIFIIPYHSFFHCSKFNMGVVDQLSKMCSFTHTKNSLHKRRKKPLQTVVLKVKMDCDGCERKVRHAVKSLRGVRSYEVNRKLSRVSVTGYVEQAKVLKRIKSTGKHAEPWPYAPYNMVPYPYVPGVYDKKAPTGFVRKPTQPVSPNDYGEKYTWLFNDDNTNACSIM